MVFMNKGLFVLVLVCLFVSGFAFAIDVDSISGYQVPSNVPLNQKITASGIFDTNGVRNNVLCSFYFYELNGNLIARATDQYTTTTGRFAMNGTLLKEPTFVRGETYVLRTECGTVYADANFSVGQKQEAFDFFGFKFYPQGTVMDFMYFKDNGLMVFFLFIMIFFFASVLILGAENLFG